MPPGAWRHITGPFNPSSVDFPLLVIPASFFFWCINNLRRALVVSDLVNLRLQIGDDLPWDLVAEQLEQIDALVAGDGLDGGHLDALLHALDGGIAGDQLLRLGLSDRFVRQGSSVPFLGGGQGHGDDGKQADGDFHFC